MMADHTPSRHEKSLGLLTTKFVSLLQEAKDGVLDLKIAADTLAVRQKRRIYDITNVLEGIGLIEKKSKNSIQWKGAVTSYASQDTPEHIGAVPGSNTREISDRLITLKDEIDSLERREQELDEHKMWVQQSIKNVTDEVTNTQLAFVTHEDICRCFLGDTLLAIQAPSGTQLEVPIPEMGPGYKKNYQIHLKSHAGSINVLLVNKDADQTSPVVVQVPPPQEELTGQPRVAVPTENVDPNQTAQPKGRSPTKRTASKSPLRQTQAVMGHETAAVPITRMATRSSPRKNAQGPVPSTSQGPAPNQHNPIPDVHPTDILFDSLKPDFDSVDGELLEELMSSEAFAPLLRLSPPPSDRDYYFNLDDNEGACDLFDVPLMSM